MLANRLRAGRKRVTPFVYGYIDFNFGQADQPGSVPLNRPDRKQFGYSLDLSIGSISFGDPFQGYTVGEIRERIEFNTFDGSYGTVTSRQVWFELRSGPIPLIITDISSVICPMGQTLLTSDVDYFIQTANDGQWGWDVTTGSDKFPDYNQSGSFQVNP